VVDDDAPVAPIDYGVGDEVRLDEGKMMASTAHLPTSWSGCWARLVMEAAW
jgi:hypothetical protein